MSYLRGSITPGLAPDGAPRHGERDVFWNIALIGLLVPLDALRGDGGGAALACGHQRRGPWPEEEGGGATQSPGHGGRRLRRELVLTESDVTRRECPELS